MKIYGMQARQMHRYSFRTGEWATVIGTAMIKPDDDCGLRPCFMVAFPDGVFDYWAIDDSDAMTEFRAPAQDHRSSVPSDSNKIDPEGKT